MSDETGGPQRRSNYAGMPMSYAAVGASRAPDLLRFPPEGSTPFEESVRLGSGQERYLTASSLLMTWNAQSRAGGAVTEVERGEGERYGGVVFDPEGRPVPPEGAEDRFGPDGEPYLTAGTTADYVRDRTTESRRVMVVYTVEEPRRVGFAWGTADTDGVIGEVLYFVEHREDESVWAVARGFLTAPSSGVLGLKARSLLKSAIAAVRKQIEALGPQAATSEVAEAPESLEAAQATEAGPADSAQEY
ncbi:DUF1990 family protein [Leucobacter sp. GX24907]